MKVQGKEYRTIWIEGQDVLMIDQNALPFNFNIIKCKNHLDTCHAIKIMTIRGAGAIGAAAAYAMAQAAMEAPQHTYYEYIAQAKETIESTRPTAQNLFYATQRVFKAAKDGVEQAIEEAKAIINEDMICTKKIGEYGNSLIKDDYKIETHCNAGCLAFVDYGTALSPIYTAHKSGKNIFVWVDETRPRNQGARLTAWELHNENIPHKIISDNAGAYLMANGEIDLIIVGADRIAANGDVANKIGTLEKAIVASYYNIPFYVAAPSSTFHIDCKTGMEIPIEERSEDEVLWTVGVDKDNNKHHILVASPGSSAYNPAFDVTPAKLISGIITEKGIIKANNIEIKKLCNYSSDLKC